MPRKEARKLHGELIGLAVEEAVAALLLELVPPRWDIEWTQWMSDLDKRGIDYLFKRTDRKFILAVDLKQDRTLGFDLTSSPGGGVEVDDRVIKRIIVWYGKPRCWNDYENDNGEIDEIDEEQWENDVRAIAEFILEVVDSTYQNIMRKSSKVRITYKRR